MVHEKPVNEDYFLAKIWKHEYTSCFEIKVLVQDLPKFRNCLETARYLPLIENNFIRLLPIKELGTVFICGKQFLENGFNPGKCRFCSEYIEDEARIKKLLDKEETLL